MFVYCYTGLDENGHVRFAHLAGQGDLASNVCHVILLKTKGFDNRLFCCFGEENNKKLKEATDGGYCSRIKMVKDKQCGSSKLHVRSYRLLNRHKTRTTAQFKQLIKHEAKNLQNSKFVDDIDMSKISRR